MKNVREQENSFLLLALSFGAPLLLLLLFWAIWVRPTYFPSGDEFALLVASAKIFHPSVSAWFKDGFSHYFLAYPGLSRPSTDFVRPVANAAYFANSLIFGSHWSYYLLLTYTVQAGLVFMTVKLALKVYKLPPRYCIVVGALLFLSPALNGQALYFPSFGFDLLAAFFVVFSFSELAEQRYVTAWVALLVAVFTKETALFAAVCAACMVWFPSQGRSNPVKRVCWTGVWLLPVFAWLLVRHLAFSGHAGIYVLKSFTFRAQVLNVLHGFLAWPFGTRTSGQSEAYRLLFFPLNALFWVISC